MMPSKHPKECLYDIVCGPTTSNLWASFPMEAQARLVLPKLATKQGPTKQKGMPPNISSQRYHQKFKPYLINKAPKHVHQTASSN
jgi:hypothetical protein